MKQCYFCANNIKEIDYKETEILKKFLDFQAKILPKEETSVCAKHQRRLSRAIKNSRIMALLPFVAH
jgi:small subunit ribosomal protein S18